MLNELLFFQISAGNKPLFLNLHQWLSILMAVALYKKEILWQKLNGKLIPLIQKFSLK